MVTIGITAILTVLTLWVLVRPHFEEGHLRDGHEGGRDGEGAATLEELDRGAAILDQRTRCLQLLKDLELDYQMKKIEESDYQQMRRPLMRELAEILERERSR